MVAVEILLACDIVSWFSHASGISIIIACGRL